MRAEPFPVADLFDRLPDVVFFAKDREGRYVRANHFKATVGLTPRAFRDRGIDDARSVLL